MRQSEFKIKVGDRLQVKVTNVTSNRIFARLPDGRSGMIRQREMSWKIERPDPHNLANVGEEIAAVVLSIDPEKKNVELSLRFAEYDPWVEYIQNCSVGDVLDGTVTNVREFGAFVEIVPGVIGLIPVSEIRFNERVEKAQDVLWPGDRVRTVVKDFQPAERLMRLSIKDYLKSLPSSASDASKSVHSMIEFLEPAMQRKIKQILGDIPKPFVCPEPGCILYILVVDDHTGFRESMVELLREWGYVVAEAKDLKEAGEQISHRPFDVIFLDLSLSDGSSIELASRVKQETPQTNILLLSGIDTQEELVRIAQANQIPMEYKPFGTEPLADYLRNLELAPETFPNGSEYKIQIPLNRQKVPGIYTDSNLLQLIQDFVDKTKAQGAVMFQESTRKAGEIECLVSCEISIEDSEETRTTLRYSPVGDVIRSQKVLIIQDVNENPNQSKYLLQAIPFRSCVGYPVFSPIDSRVMALFLFSKQTGHFTGQELSGADYKNMESFLFRQSIFTVLLSTQREVLRSHLRAGALHDVSNSLGSIDYKMSRLVERTNELEDEYTKSTVIEIGNLANEIQENAKQMGKTLETFRFLGRIETSEQVDINAIARRSVQRQMLLANHLNVHLSFTPATAMPDVNLNPAYLQQTLDNIILNAIQWCADCRVHHVSVTTVFEAEDTRYPIKIRVDDTGHGIHQSQQKGRIYELGYSLRKDGSGIGLFVAQALVKAMGGNITVERSIMEIGTTFLIELPVK